MSRERLYSGSCQCVCTFIDKVLPNAWTGSQKKVSATSRQQSRHISELRATASCLISSNTGHLPFYHGFVQIPFLEWAASVNSTPITQGVAEWGGRYHHSFTRQLLLAMQGWGYITCLRTLKEWLCYKRSLNSLLCPVFGLFLSYSLPGTTDGWRNERLVVQRAPWWPLQVRSTSIFKSWCITNEVFLIDLTHF